MLKPWQVEQLKDLFKRGVPEQLSKDDQMKKDAVRTTPRKRGTAFTLARASRKARGCCGRLCSATSASVSPSRGTMPFSAPPGCLRTQRRSNAAS